jgi:hypothetical protein
VERRHGALEHSWRGEEDGVAALLAVWNHDKPSPAPHLPYHDRAGFDLDRVWAGLAQTRVERSVDTQGKLSVGDRPLGLGSRWAERTVVVTFDATRRVAVVRDKQEHVLSEHPLPWLTEDWLWAGCDAPPQPLDHAGTSTLR